jgi:3-hydroxy-9,10-secoandrosta-1,3,5(10)-triene-9,17-dione monooxygenase
VSGHEVLDRVREITPLLQAQAPEAEALRRLPDETAKQLKDAGVVRLLQPRRHGGYEADPRIFFEACMEIARSCGASGWVSGIVGVHPWELAFYDEKAQEEVWGEDPDTWVSSQYQPGGTARPVPGGYVVNGRWGFSSGCHHCDWVFLGVIVLDDDGQPQDPPDIRHFLLPRSDYTIIEGSWMTMGLCGTGSNDLVVEEAFVPEHRVLPGAWLHNATGPGLERNDGPLYRMPWAAIFPNAITAAVIGIAQGVLDAHLAYQMKRVSPVAGRMIESSPSMTAVGEAAAEIEASRLQLLTNVGQMYDITSRGEQIPTEVRARGRRDQVQGSWRAVRAVDEIMARSGGGAIRLDNPIQRLWRDAHAGLAHVINVPDKSFHSYTYVAMGLEPLEAMI